MNRLFIQSVAALGIAAGAVANPPQREAAPMPAVAQPRTELAAYIGIATSSAPATLREQLKLPRGVGLVVEYVDPESPAERAGLRAHDVIHKFNDQIIINAAQLTVLVRLSKPGEVARLTVVRRGESEQIAVTLGERELPVFDEPTALLTTPQDRAGGPLPRPGAGAISGVITHSDGTHNITISSHDNSRELVIKDSEGKVIYSGRLNTDLDRQRIPPELREKVAQVERNSEKLREVRRGATAPQKDAELPPERDQ